MPTKNQSLAYGIPVELKPNSTRFIDPYRAWLRLNGYAYRTEQTYIHWVLFYKKKKGNQIYSSQTKSPPQKNLSSILRFIRRFALSIADTKLKAVRSE